MNWNRMEQISAALVRAGLIVVQVLLAVGDSITELTVALSPMVSKSCVLA